MRISRRRRTGSASVSRSRDEPLPRPPGRGRCTHVADRLRASPRGSRADRGLVARASGRPRRRRARSGRRVASSSPSATASSTPWPMPSCAAPQVIVWCAVVERRRLVHHQRRRPDRLVLLLGRADADQHGRVPGRRVREHAERRGGGRAAAAGEHDVDVAAVRLRRRPSPRRSGRRARRASPCSARPSRSRTARSASPVSSRSNALLDLARAAAGARSAGRAAAGRGGTGRGSARSRARDRDEP